MKAIIDQSSEQAQSIEHRRPRAKRLLLALLGVVLAATATVVLVNNQALLPIAALEQASTTASEVAQPQRTPPAGRPARPADQDPGNVVRAGVPLTATVGMTGTLPATGDQPAGAAAPDPVATPTATPVVALPVTIVAIAGGDGATLLAFDGDAPAQVLPPGTRLALTGRAADGTWLVAEDSGAQRWVSRADVIAFNLERLDIVAATPPTTAPASAEADEAMLPAAVVADEMAATAVTTATIVADAVVNEAEDESAEATSTDVAAGASSTAAPVTATLDTGKASALNVRSGPGAAYARLGAVAAEDALAITARNAAGDWLYATLSGADLTGWVAAHYLVVTGDIDDLPKLQSPAAVDATPPATVPTPAAPATAAPVQAAQSTGLEGTLVFQTGQGGAIYTYDLATGEQWPLTTGFDPAISPDGSTVAFARIGNDAGLYLIDSDGSNERQIYSGPEVIASPKWSEDGSEIVFSYATSSRACRDVGGGTCVSDEEFETRRFKDADPNDYPLVTVYTYDLGVVAADGSGFHSLGALASARAPDWRSAGIVYESSAGLQVIQDEAGATSSLVAHDPLKPAYKDPDWAGGHIVFQQQGASHWEIWAVGADGAGMVALTAPQTVLVDQLPSNVSPAWSPDGSQIVFLSNREADGEAGQWRIWVMNADGSNQRALPIDVALNYTFGSEQMVSWGG